MYRHAVVIIPVARWVLIARGPAYSSLALHPQRQRPSLLSCRVGVHIGRIEACSTYGLSARCIAKATYISRRLRRFRHLHRRSDSYRLERPVAWWELQPLRKNRWHGAQLSLTPQSPKRLTPRSPICRIPPGGRFASSTCAAQAERWPRVTLSSCYWLLTAVLSSGRAGGV
jgi:hypothetical protein